MKRYPRIHRFDHETMAEIDSTGSVIITEKLDGSNFRFTYDSPEGFTFGSRNTVGDELARGQFRDPIDFIEAECDVDKLLSLQDEYGAFVMFGEAMNPHTISYDWDQTPPFIGFDVWNVESQTFHHTEQSKEFIEAIGLPFIPIVGTISATDLDKPEELIPQSGYHEGAAEGIVLKNHDTETYGKIVRDAFKEKQHTPKEYLSDTERIVAKYVTPARVKSVAHQLVADGKWNTIELPMMEILPEAVIRNTMTEEGGTLVMEENIDFDTREFRSLVSKKCATIINKMVDE